MWFCLADEFCCPFCQDLVNFVTSDDIKVRVTALHTCSDLRLSQASEIRQLARSVATPAPPATTPYGSLPTSPSPVTGRQKSRVKAVPLSVCRGCGPLFEFVKQVNALERGAKLAKRQEGIVSSTLRSATQLREELSRGTQGKKGRA